MVLIILALDEPQRGITVDESDPMDRRDAENAVAYIREGLMWDPSTRQFDYKYGFRVARARIVPVNG